MAITDIDVLPFGDPFGHFATDETSAQWLAQVAVDLDDYDNARFAAVLGATIRATGGAIPTFKIYMYCAGSPLAPPAILDLTPASSPATWTSSLVSASRVVGRGLTTFSLYGWTSPGAGTIEINAASLTLEFSDVDPAPRRAPPGPVGGDDIWLAEVD